MTEPFQFAERRHQTIYANLAELIGDGPSLHFRDACRLIDAQPPHDAASNIVGNLLREIEGAVRATSLLFVPAGPIAKTREELLAETLSSHGIALDAPIARDLTELCASERNDRPHSQAAEIRAILTRLEIEPRDTVEAAWIGLAGNLHRLTHRRALDAPRPPDDGLRTAFDRLLLLLEALIPRLRAQYSAYFAAVDRLRAIAVPTRRDVAVFTEQIPRHIQLQERFFQDLAPAWLGPLRRFFASSLRPHEDEDGRFLFSTGWPAYRYLGRMAALADKKTDVLAVLSKIEEPRNPYFLRDLARVLIPLPPLDGHAFASRMMHWIERLESWPPLLLEALLEVSTSYARNGDSSLLRRVIALSLVLKKSGEPRHIESYEFDRLLRVHLSGAAGVIPSADLMPLCLRALADSLVLPDGSPSEELRGDSTAWRPTIEDSSQNGFEDARSELISAVRQLLGAELAGGANVGDVIAALKGRSPQLGIHRRLSLYALSISESVPSDTAESLLLDESLAMDSEVFHEYALGLAARFKGLSESGQKRLLELIHRLGGYRELTRLTLIAPWLGDDERRRYEVLIRDKGLPKHPAFLSFTKASFGFLGLSSPVTSEELSAMPPEQLFGFLESFEPGLNPFEGPSPEGVGRQVQERIAKDPMTFAVSADLLLFSEPTFARSVLDGFGAALAGGLDIPWDTVVALCLGVLKKPFDGSNLALPLGRDPGWGWARGSVLHLLQKALKARPARIPPGLRTKIWEIIEGLAASPVGDDVPSANRDPVSSCVNSLRGQSLECVLDYAAWVKSEGGNTPARGLIAVPEIQPTLEENVRKETQPSLAIHSFFGLNLGRLFALDTAWAISNLEQIFPSDAPAYSYWRAAWDAFVRYSGPLTRVFESMRNTYQTALSTRLELADERDTAPLSLAEHLVILYGAGVLDLNDPLLTTFFDNAGDRGRAHFIRMAGRSLVSTDTSVTPAIVERFVTLGARRLDDIALIGSTDSVMDELRAFGWWFVADALPVEWSASLLV